VPLYLACPDCGRNLTAPDSAVGKRLRCPECQAIFNAPTELPTASPFAAEPAPSAGPPSPGAGEPWPGAGEPAPGAGEPPPDGVFDAEEIGAEEIRDKSGATAPFAPGDQERRPCSVCGEMIVANAAKCRFCGAIFDPVLRRAEERRRVKPEDSDMGGGEWLLCILCAGIGCIVGIVYAIQGKPKGAKMIGVSIVAAIVWNIFRFIIASANRAPFGP
jgi:hypothetical protein